MGFDIKIPMQTYIAVKCPLYEGGSSSLKKEGDCNFTAVF